MRTRTLIEPAAACDAAGRTSVVSAPATSVVVVAPAWSVTSTCAIDCAVASGWLGVHAMVSAVPVATTSGTLTRGASGAHSVATSLDSAHAPYSVTGDEPPEDLSARTRKRTVPFGGSAHTQSPSNAASAHVAPPSVEAWNSQEST